MVESDTSPVVLVQFPRMNAPFSKCDPFDKNKTMRQLTVDFRGENDFPELENFKSFQKTLGARLSQLVHMAHGRVNAVESKKWSPEDNENGYPLTKMAPLVKPNKNPDYPDRMVLKFQPGDATFEGQYGEPLQEKDIDFRTVDVECTARLLDLWEYGGTYHPRYFLTHCRVYRRQPVNAIHG